MLQPYAIREPYPRRSPPRTAAATRRAGTRRRGAKRPASPAPSSAPRTSPRSMTDVTSANTGAASADCWNSPDQNATPERSYPIATSPFAPQSAKAQVMDHGVPATTSVTRLRSARRTAPTPSGHGPRRDRAAHGDAEDLAGGEDGREEHGRHREHQELRPHAAAVAHGHEVAVRPGEAEDGVMEGETEGGADEEERALPRAIVRHEPESADREDAGGARHDRRLDGPARERGRPGRDGWGDDAAHRAGASPRARRPISISTSRVSPAVRTSRGKAIRTLARRSPRRRRSLKPRPSTSTIVAASASSPA